MPQGPMEPEPIRPAGTAGRAPLLWVAAAVLAGYTLDGLWPAAHPILLLAAVLPPTVGALALALAGPVKNFRQWRWRGAWAFCFLLAATFLAWAWRDLRVPALPPEASALPSREATLTLRITRTFRAATPDSDYVSGLAQVVDPPLIFQELRGQSISYRARLVKGDSIPPAVGATVKIQGLLSFLPDIAPDITPDPSSTPTAASIAASNARFRKYLHNQGVWFELARGPLLREVSPPNAWTRWLTAQHMRLESLLRQGPSTWENKWGDTYVALVLGEPSLLDESQREAFTVAGVVYLFAISGLHVFVVAVALSWLWRQVPRLPRWLADLLTLLMIWLYVEVCGGTPSARRAALMLTIYLLSVWLGRARGPLPAVLLAGIVTVLIDPLALQSSGFQLSYGVVFGLILYAPKLRESARATFRPWRDLPAHSLAPWQRCVLWLGDRMLDLAVTAWTALLCSAPLTAEFFGRFSVNGLVLNLLVFPLTCLILWAGAAAVLSGIFRLPPLTWLGWAINAIGLAGIGLMQHVAGLAPGLPGLYTQLQLVPAWAGSAATLAVLAVMLLAQPGDRPPRWWYFALPVLVIATFAIFTAHAA